jgi:hypothetical protein
MKLGEQPWWPKTWTRPIYKTIPAEKIRKDGIFVGCELFPHELMIRVDYNGMDASGRIARGNVNAPANLLPIIDFLSDYTGSSMQSIEDLEF